MSDLGKKYIKILKYEPKSPKKGVFVPKIGKIYEFFPYVGFGRGKQEKFLILRKEEGDTMSYPVPIEDISWEIVEIEENTIS